MAERGNEPQPPRVKRPPIQIPTCLGYGTPDSKREFTLCLCVLERKTKERVVLEESVFIPFSRFGRLRVLLPSVQLSGMENLTFVQLGTVRICSGYPSEQPPVVPMSSLICENYVLLKPNHSETILKPNHSEIKTVLKSKPF